MSSCAEPNRPGLCGRWACIALLCLGALATACGGKSPPKKAQPIAVDPNLAPNFKLGDASIPKRYRLRLAMDPTQAEFTGEVRIDVELTRPLHTLWLHQKKLEIKSASFHRDGLRIPLEERKSESDSELLGLASSEELSAGLGQIYIEFSGQFGSREALFRQLESERWYAYSDFEATDARAAFPCYDEPRFKVPYHVEVQVPEGNLAFANAPETSRDKQADGSWLFRFAETRPLPSYLVAVAAGPFDLIEGKASNTPLRIIAPKGQAHFGRFVLESTGQWIRDLESYLGMAMPFRKLDFIAVPHFGGAMENPGLVTYSANILLNPPGTHADQLRRAAGIVGHELVHMWFGNLLTPLDWNDLWLNEAFATWLSDKLVAQWQPDRAREVLDIADKSTAFASDHSLHGRQVRQPITNREQIRDAFDAITYRKGGALLTMLEGWLGEERMRDAVRGYLHKHDGGSVSAPDLISAMRAVAPKAHLDEIFKSYLEQPGIPQVSARLRCGDKIQVELSQTRYLPFLEQERAQEREKDLRWSIPVCLRYPTEKGTARQCTLLSDKRMVLGLQSSRCPTWILPNDRESGYYHYLLDDAGFAALRDAKLDDREVLGLVHNLTAALQGGHIGVGSALDRLEAWAPNGGFHVQQAVIPLLYLLERSVVGDSERAAFAGRIRRWYQERLTSLGMSSRPGDSKVARLLRPVFIHLLAELGDDRELQSKARAIAEAWLKVPTSADLNLLDSILQAAAIHGDADQAGRYFDLMTKAKEGRHSALLLGALHAFTNPTLFKGALEISVPERLALPNLMPALFRALTSKPLRKILLSKLFEKREAILGAGSTSDSSRREDNYARMAELFAKLCDEDGKAAAKRFAADEFEVGPVIKSIESCMAFAAAQQESGREAFTQR